MEKYIIKALNSIFEQYNQENFCDVYIIDDGSSDNSKIIIESFINTNKLVNFKLISKENGNWGSVINYAKNNLEINSKYITILDADDFYEKDLFDKLEEHIDEDYDLIFTGFYEIKKKNKIHKGYITPQRGNRMMEKKYMRFPSLIPLCKFFKTELFLKLDDLKEKVSYQDIVLWNKFVDISNSFYYVKSEHGYYLNHREGASSTSPFNEERINVMMEIINSLISDNKYTNGYLMALLMHLKKNTPKKNRKYIKLENDYKKIKNFKLLWCPFGTRIITKIGMYIYLNKLLRKGNL
ncbi:MAG: glycosyltransferase [Mycoplasma sp.]|nr:glycosyltransferase [Mycoplasma sp.]